MHRALIQVLNVGGIKFDDTRLILPTVKFSSTPIFLTIQYELRMTQVVYDNWSFGNLKCNTVKTIVIVINPSIIIAV